MRSPAKVSLEGTNKIGKQEIYPKDAEGAEDLESMRDACYKFHMPFNRKITQFFQIVLLTSLYVLCLRIS